MGTEDSHTKLYFMTRMSRAAATSCFEEQEKAVFMKTKTEEPISTVSAVTEIIFEYAQWQNGSID